MAAAGAVALWVAVGGAQTSFPEKAEKAKAAGAKAGAQTMVVTGCVAAGSDAGHFMLTNGMTTGDTSGRSYQLIGSDLSAHVGHEVEVTGTASGDKITKGKAAAKTATGDAKSQNNTSMTDRPTTLTVQSVKMIAATCS
jgi:hypothetical protein